MSATSSLISCGNDAFSGVECVRLWLSYQRYAYLLFLGPIAVVFSLFWVWPSAWWLWVPAALISLRILAFSREIYERWPKKIQATRQADQRIAEGRFEPDSVQRLCTDPCFRVVAREILRRAEVAPSARRTIIKRLSAIERARGHTLLVVNHDKSVVVEIGGTATTYTLGADPHLTTASDGDGRQQVEGE